MADATGKKLLDLLSPARPADLRAAAALVLGEVGADNNHLHKTLCSALEDADPAVRLRVLEAIGKLRVEEALPRLLVLVKEGGSEAEKAAHAAAHVGAKGVKGLRGLMEDAPPGLRRIIAGALGASGSASAEVAAVDALLDKDPRVVDAAARSLISEVPALSAHHRQALVKHVLELMRGGKKAKLNPASEAALIRLLGALGDPKAEAIFWARVDAAHPVELRAAALQALGTLAAPTHVDKLKQLLACARESDFKVVAPTLMILKNAPVQDRVVKEWLKLLDAPDPAARKFAVEKVGNRDTRETAAALVRQVHHQDQTLREQSMAALAKLEHGREALASALQEAATPEAAWALARTLSDLARAFSPQLRGKIFSRACEFQEANDRRAEPLFFLLRHAHGKDLRDRLEEKALELRKKKNYEQALDYLRLLTRDPHCAETHRFELAACGLKMSSKDLSPEMRAADPCLEQFAALLHRHETPPIDYVAKAKWLDSDELFYLGFHFAEKNQQEKEFGGAVLKRIVDGSPRHKIAKDAKSKLRREGFE